FISFYTVITCKGWVRFSFIKYKGYIITFGGSNSLNKILYYNIKNNKWFKSNCVLPYGYFSFSNNICIDNSYQIHIIGGRYETQKHMIFNFKDLDLYSKVFVKYFPLIINNWIRFCGNKLRWVDDVTLLIIKY